jgi:hypothetical protein
MSTTTTSPRATHALFEPLPEPYLCGLVSNAYQPGAEQEVCSDIITAITTRSADGARNNAMAIAAMRQVHQAMGQLEHTIGAISEDFSEQRRDWNRIDDLMEAPHAAADRQWLVEQLRGAADQAGASYEQHRGASWAEDLLRAQKHLNSALRLLDSVSVAVPTPITNQDSARLCRCAVSGVDAYAMDLPESLTAQQREVVIGVIRSAVGSALMEFFAADRGGISDGTYQVLSEEIAEALEKQEPQP